MAARLRALFPQRDVQKRETVSIVDVVVLVCAEYVYTNTQISLFSLIKNINIDITESRLVMVNNNGFWKFESFSLQCDEVNQRKTTKIDLTCTPI